MAECMNGIRSTVFCPARWDADPRPAAGAPTDEERARMVAAGRIAAP